MSFKVFGSVGPPTAMELMRQSAQTQGTAGAVHGWNADESHLPDTAWRVFHFLSSRWIGVGRVPKPLLHARTAYLPKQKKVTHGGTQAIKTARPIL